MESVERWLPATIGLLVTGVPTGWLLWQFGLAVLSRRWPTVRGTVVRSRVFKHRRGAVHDICYLYEVDGIAYEGSRVRFAGTLNRSTRYAEVTRDAYPSGSRVEVRYQPGRPERSTLEPRPARILWLWLPLGLFFAGSIAGALMGFWE